MLQLDWLRLLCHQESFGTGLAHFVTQEPGKGMARNLFASFSLVLDAQFHRGDGELRRAHRQAPADAGRWFMFQTKRLHGPSQYLDTRHGAAQQGWLLHFARAAHDQPLRSKTRRIKPRLHLRAREAGPRLGSL